MKTIAEQLNVKEFPFIIKNSNGNMIYIEYANKFWVKNTFDLYDNQIYSENSEGYIISGRVDSCGNPIHPTRKIRKLTMNEIAKKFDVDVKNLKVIK